MMQFLLILFCGFWGGGCLFVCLFSRTPESYPAFIQFKRKGSGKKSFLATKLIRHQILAVITAPVAQYRRAAPYLHSCSPAIPLIYKIMERTGMQSRGI